MDIDDLETHSNASITSSIEGLITDVQGVFEEIIGNAQTNGESYIIRKDALANGLHALTALMDAIPEAVLKPRTTTPPSPQLDQILTRLNAIETKLNRRGREAVPTAPRTWASIAAARTHTASHPQGRAATVRPTADLYRGKAPSAILQELKKDFPGAVGVRPLRSGDIRVIFKDTKAKDHAIGIGKGGGAKVLRQDFPVEVPAVPLDQIKIVHGRAGTGVGNKDVIQGITKENKHLPHIVPSPIVRLAWIHGNRTLNAGKKRSSLIMYFCSEAAREVAVREGVIIQGVWYRTKLWAHSLSTPRCYNCGLWGHTQGSCAKAAACGHCAGKHDTKNCHQTDRTSCSNCGRKHKQWDRSCPVYQAAKQGSAAARNLLDEETFRLWTRQPDRTQNAISTLPQRTLLALQPQPRRAGRPALFERAELTAGQRPLTNWAQPRVEDSTEMEE